MARLEVSDPTAEAVLSALMFKAPLSDFMFEV
jgi:hypothetical protein